MGGIHKKVHGTFSAGILGAGQMQRENQIGTKRLLNTRGVDRIVQTVERLEAKVIISSEYRSLLRVADYGRLDGVY